MRLRLSVICLLLAAICVSGCLGAKETDEVAYVLAIGVDKQPDGQLMVSYQVAVPRGAGGDESGGAAEGSKTSVIVSVVAPSIAEARNLLETTVARSPNLSHNKAFILGEDLARDGITPVMGPLMRYREYRGTMYIMVSRGTAKDFLNANKPVLEALPAKYLELMELSNLDSAYFPRVHLHDFYQKMKTNSAEPVAVYVATNPLQGIMQESEEKTPGSPVRNYKAGEAPREGGNPVVFMGSAVFSGDKMVDLLNNVETRAMLLLQGEKWKGFLVVDDPLAAGQSVNLAVRPGRQPKIDVELANGQATIKADVFMEAEISAISSNLNYEGPEHKPLLEQQVSEVLRQQMLQMIAKTQKVRADVVGFGYHIRSQFRTHTELDQVEWEDFYQNATVEVNVTTKIRRTGLQWRTTPSQK